MDHFVLPLKTDVFLQDLARQLFTYLHIFSNVGT